MQLAASNSVSRHRRFYRIFDKPQDFQLCIGFTLVRWLYALDIICTVTPVNLVYAPFYLIHLWHGSIPLTLKIHVAVGRTLVPRATHCLLPMKDVCAGGKFHFLSRGFCSTARVSRTRCPQRWHREILLRRIKQARHIVSTIAGNGGNPEPLFVY